MENSRGRKILGVVLIALGALFFLRNLDIFGYEFMYYFLSWPVFFMIGGLIVAIVSRGKVFGIIMFSFGAIYFVSRLMDYPVGWILRDFWPIILIGIGVSFIFRHQKNRTMSNKEKYEEYSQDYVDVTSIINHIRRKIISNDFKGGSLTTLLGGTTLDLREAKLSSMSERLEVINIFGGTEILASADIRVINNTTAIFGGSEDKRKNIKQHVDEPKVLVITGFALFGGVVVNS